VSGLACTTAARAQAIHGSISSRAAFIWLKNRDPALPDVLGLLLCDWAAEIVRDEIVARSAAHCSAVIGRVERSLYQRANGYNYEAVKIFMPARSKQPVVVHYTEHLPPDVAAGMFWLKNRDPDNWRDVQNVDHVLGKYIISDHPMSEEQWAAERATIIDEKVVEELPAPTRVGAETLPH
jgi:hypothetical protein